MAPDRLSIRARLTLTVIALTAVAGLAAVWVGLRAFEDIVRQRAVDDQVDFVSEEFTVIVEEGDGSVLVDGEEIGTEIIVADDGSAEVVVPGIGGDVVADELSAAELEALEALDDLEGGGVLELDEGFEEAVVVDGLDWFGDAEALAVAAQRTLADLDEVGLVDPLFDTFAGDDGQLHVLLFDASVTALPRPPAEEAVGRPEGSEPPEIYPIDEVAPGEVLVLQADLEELQAVSFEPFVAEQAVAARDLETAVVDFDDLQLGLIIDVTDELSALDGIRASLWSAAAALPLLAGVATWLLTGRALRPVAAITRRVDAISSGTLDGRVPEPDTGDEIGVLAVTMNRMLGRLERSDRQRRQFVSDASHELRTPVAVLRSEAEVARRAPATTTVDGFAEVVLGETARLERLVEDLLTLARADENRLIGGADIGGGRAGSDEWPEIDVDDVVLAEAARTRRLPVDRSRVSAGRIRGRANDLARAVGHLLDNAARHGESTVVVGVATVDDAVRVWVDDDGAGIPEPDRQRVLERFVRLDEARDRDRGGSGLGLAVVAEAAAALGGSVTIGRSDLGGARVELHLPAATEVDVPSASPPTRPMP